MEIKSYDMKNLTVDTEKGPLTVFLPIGLDIQEAFDILCKYTGIVGNALKKSEKEKENSKEENQELCQQEC